MLENWYNPFFEHFNFTSLLSEELHMKRGLDMHNFSVIEATLEREEVAFQGSCLFISDWNTTFSAKWNRLISLRIHLYSHRMQSGLLNFQEMEPTIYSQAMETI